MELIFSIFTDYITEIVIVMSLLNFILLLLFIISRIKISSITKKYDRLVQGSTTHSLESILFEHIEEIRSTKEEIAEIKKRCENLDDRLQFCLQRIGFIRYNAFNDMGSDLSFSVALLDDKLNGFIITSIYGRNESKTYAKPVVKGDSNYPLSVEEIQALDRAKKQIVS
ncbi:hypothetical protein DW1_2958 [Proteiniborus sp. DW1]|uniref:DUF4446 family protein n=1 Tax=Proteiniborus sp. DW1 TaxID=1889883 RepID=UPI00092DEC4A|nr:DUF4446 family protein [Proteiniborus sp. DW1]SCG84508.1 hypothetical protein DW1_2958 [Proteiniborus sp. DW1]